MVFVQFSLINHALYGFQIWFPYKLDQSLLSIKKKAYSLHDS
jgi:hypothetical protein